MENLIQKSLNFIYLKKPLDTNDVEIIILKNNSKNLNGYENHFDDDIKPLHIELHKMDR